MNDRYPIDSKQRVYGFISELYTLQQQGRLSLKAYESMRDMLIDSHFKSLDYFERQQRGNHDRQQSTIS